MNTHDLARALAADGGRPRSLRGGLVRAWLAGLVGAAALFALLLAPRPDLASAVAKPAFWLKLLIVGATAATAATALASVARPLPQRSLLSLLVAPLLLALGLLLQFASIPAFAGGADPVFRGLMCTCFIPLLSAPVAVCLLIAMRRGAPAHPGLAGAVAGLAAGGLGATLYAFACPADSPAFIATWYSLAIGIVTIACYAIGRRALRW